MKDHLDAKQRQRLTSKLKNHFKVQSLSDVKILHVLSSKTMLFSNRCKLRINIFIDD